MPKRGNPSWVLFGSFSQRERTINYSNLFHQSSGCCFTSASTLPQRRDSASAEAAKGLSGRPLETFGSLRLEGMNNKPLRLESLADRRSNADRNGSSPYADPQTTEPSSISRGRQSTTALNLLYKETPPDCYPEGSLCLIRDELPASQSFPERKEPPTPYSCQAVPAHPACSRASPRCGEGSAASQPRRSACCRR